jgi:glycine/D-amino acid oxidase-like deaminating enzyme
MLKFAVIHDCDDSVYMCHLPNGSMAIGGFVRAAMEPVQYEHPDFNPKTLPDDWDKFCEWRHSTHLYCNVHSIDPILDKAVARFPAIGKASVERLVTGADGYTPDGGPIVGYVNNVSYKANKACHQVRVTVTQLHDMCWYEWQWCFAGGWIRCIMR